MRKAVIIFLLGVSYASAEVRIHDPVVSALAKPFGIEKRIRLKSIDALHFGPGGESRLKLTLDNSGVRKVVLNDSVFDLECANAEGKLEKLGELKAEQIVFPITEDDASVSRTYVVELTSALPGAELTKRIRNAAAAGRGIRLIGRSDMQVSKGEGGVFSRNRLKLELTGTTQLGRGFKSAWYDSNKKLPACGVLR